MSNNLSGRIGESELILSSSRNIYHLDLAPEHVAPTVITVGDPGRVGEVSKYFDRITHRAQHREFVTHTGYIGNKYISVVSTGIGPDNIDIVLNELDALVNIDMHTRKVKEEKTSLSIIRLGTCGALQADIPVDSMIISSYAIGLDNLLHYYKPVNNAEEAFLVDSFVKHAGLERQNVVPYVAASSIALRRHFGSEYVHGVTVTCPGFYGPQGRVLRLPLAHPTLIDALTSFSSGDNRVTNFEMETSAIYGLGKLMGHKCLSISTAVANRVTQTFTKDGGKAVERMIKHSLEIISSIG